jgi:outer membrane protein assembly factor BamB
MRTWTVTAGAVVCLLAACSEDRGGAHGAAEGRAPEHADTSIDAEERDRAMLDGAERDAVGPGNWRRARSRTSGADGGLTDEQRSEIRELEDLGYATGSHEAEAAGVTIHVRDKVSLGWNLYTSGHGPEAILMDMDGKELHRWRCEFGQAFPELSDRARSTGSQWWCWMHLFENGDVLVLFSGEGIVKLNARSEILWAKRNRAHHDVAVTDGGDIWVLTRKASVIPRIHETKPILEDFVTLLGPGGETKKSISLLAAFEGSRFPDAWRSDLEHGDVFHSNTLVLLDGCGCDRVPALAAGNVLVSLAEPDLLAVIDPKSGKVVWVHEGEFRTQHDSQIVGEGNLLLFDNDGLGNSSRALELDPATGSTVWEYRGEAGNPLLSKRMGAVQRLPNGNTLVTESESGRALEVTAAGEVVWEFHSPHHAGENGEFVATICRMRRLPPSFPVDWIPAR